MRAFPCPYTECSPSCLLALPSRYTLLDGHNHTNGLTLTILLTVLLSGPVSAFPYRHPWQPLKLPDKLSLLYWIWHACFFSGFCCVPTITFGLAWSGFAFSLCHQYMIPHISDSVGALAFIGFWFSCPLNSEGLGAFATFIQSGFCLLFSFHTFG